MLNFYLFFILRPKVIDVVAGFAVALSKRSLTPHPVEVRVHDDGPEPLELRDELDEQLLHEVEQGLPQGRIVQESVRRSDKECLIIQHLHGKS